jgi:dTDP-4-dehydrorhamnose reductase
MASLGAADALIGHTGFVGGELMRRRPFGTTFSSANIGAIRGRRFDTVVCAGVSAVKWLANREPEADRAAITGLIDCLEQVEARRFVLISTIDVYRDTSRVTERDAPPKAGLHPYGLHRLELEAFVADRFASHSIVRLPALFGEGLKKNAVFDLINLNQTDRIVPNAAFQWYPTRRLAADLESIVAAGIDLINVTAEPVPTATIRDRFFPQVAIAPPAPEPPLYDVRSIYDSLLGGAGGYHLCAATVLSEMADFLETARQLS